MTDVTTVSTVYTVLVLAVLAAATVAGGRLAERVGSDRVVGEICAGLAVAVGATSLAGGAAVVPAPALSVLTLVTEAGLALFLVGVVHELAVPAVGAGRRAVPAVALATLLGPLLLGGLLGVALLSDDGLRGAGSAPAFVLFVGVAMSVTAVPVLARIVGDRGLGRTVAARVSLSAAVLQDAVCWLLFAVALALQTADSGRVVSDLAVLAGGGAVVLLLRRLLGTRAARRAAGRSPALRVATVVVTAWAAAGASQALGMTAVFGAVAAGLAFPRDGGDWASAVSAVARAARPVVPLYIGVSALGALGAAGGLPAWWVVGAVVGVAVLGKAGTGYLSARLAGLPVLDAGRIAVMANTRGLTEVVILQAGLGAGIVGGGLYVAFLVMTAVTTVVTGPVLDRLSRSERAVAAPSSA